MGSLLLCALVVACSLAASGQHIRTEYNKRNCNSIYGQFPCHSACAVKSRNLTKSGVTDAEKLEILRYHNQVRSEVNPSPCLMLKLYWDDEVAMLAQTWAETCPTKHDNYADRLIPDRFNSGQNIAFGHSSWREAEEDWHSERKNYTYGMTDFKLIGQYSQMIWGRTAAIGCGFALCDRTRIYVCNYSPAGNIFGRFPYMPCSRSTGLIDCKGIFCYNNGYMERNCTCKCRDKPGFHPNNVCIYKKIKKGYFSTSGKPSMSSTHRTERVTSEKWIETTNEVTPDYSNYVTSSVYTGKNENNQSTAAVGIIKTKHHHHHHRHHRV